MHHKSKKIHQKITNDVKLQLQQSTFYTEYFLKSIDNCLGKLGEGRKIEKLVCYGLGSFHSGVDVVSRYQLALLLLIHEHLLTSGNPINDLIDVYDPSFDSLDKETLSYFSRPKFNVLVENEYCARDISQGSPNMLSTLIYMPHLDKYLYNNLLGSNWSTDKIRKLVILGNSFQEMIDHEIPSKCRSELYYINLVVTNFKPDYEHSESSKKRKKMLGKIPSSNGDEKALIEIKIDDSMFDHSDIFNNLAFHSIEETWLEKYGLKLDATRIKNWELATPSLSQDEWID